MVTGPYKEIAPEASPDLDPEALLDDDVETNPVARRFSSFRAVAVTGTILSLVVIACVALNYNGPNNLLHQAKVADTIGLDFENVNSGGGAITGTVDKSSHIDNSVHSNYAGAQTQIGGTNAASLNVGKHVVKGTEVGTNYGDISTTIEAKKCEGSGNGVKGVGAAQVVCCYSPSGQGCCGEASAVGGRLLAASDQELIEKLQKQFMETTDPAKAELLSKKIKMLKGSSSSNNGPLGKAKWPTWSSKLPKSSTGGQCPQGTHAKA